MKDGGNHMTAISLAPAYSDSEYEAEFYKDCDFCGKQQHESLLLGSTIDMHVCSSHFETESMRNIIMQANKNQGNRGLNEEELESSVSYLTKEWNKFKKQ